MAGDGWSLLDVGDELVSPCRSCDCTSSSDGWSPRSAFSSMGPRGSVALDDDKDSEDCSGRVGSGSSGVFDQRRELRLDLDFRGCLSIVTSGLTRLSRLLRTDLRRDVPGSVGVVGCEGDWGSAAEVDDAEAAKLLLGRCCRDEF